MMTSSMHTIFLKSDNALPIMWLLFKGSISSKKFCTANTEMVKSLVEGSQYVEWLLHNIKLKCTQKSGSDDIIIIHYFFCV